jgi:DNA-binding CsgD family transcriptional regulator
MKCPHCNTDIAEQLIISEAARIQGRRSRRELSREDAQAMAARGNETRRSVLTPRQRQAWELRQAGKSLAEIAAEMGTTREPVRQWLAAAERKTKTEGGK